MSSRRSSALAELPLPARAGGAAERAFGAAGAGRGGEERQ